MKSDRKTNLKPFDVTHKDRAWQVQLKGLELSAAVKDVFADGGRLMELVTKADSLSLYRSVADVVKLADNFEDYLRLVKELQESPEEEESSATR